MSKQGTSSKYLKGVAYPSSLLSVSHPSPLSSLAAVLPVFLLYILPNKQPETMNPTNQTETMNLRKPSLLWFGFLQCDINNRKVVNKDIFTIHILVRLQKSKSDYRKVNLLRN